jgi:hypothetical protein
MNSSCDMGSARTVIIGNTKKDINNKMDRKTKYFIIGLNE